VGGATPRNPRDPPSRAGSRARQIESDEMVAKVRANDVPLEYIVFPDEGHGFRKKANQIKGYEAVLEFLDAHVAKE
jgi:dipeptidyl aminopeptidase/acylaminoacyl peptidase